MKKLIRFVVFFLILIGALAFFKPTEKDFESWVNAKSSRERENAKGDNLIEKLADKGVTTAGQMQLLATYRYTNHHVAAYVEAHANGEKKEFIGVAGFWIPLP